MINGFSIVKDVLAYLGSKAAFLLQVIILITACCMIPASRQRLIVRMLFHLHVGNMQSMIDLLHLFTDGVVLFEKRF